MQEQVGGAAAPPRRARHLLDPDNPRPAPRGAGMSLTRVQRWVASALAVTTVWHLALGLVIAAWSIEETRTVDRVGLLVVASLFGIVGVAVGLIIHRQRLFSGWLLVGLVPGAAGALWLF
ncbi:MAG TPA: hypothetical protein VFO98_16375 [Marmoricola sp.]|nr:hypothetical protein [Marmoricola sp.]